MSSPDVLDQVLRDIKKRYGNSSVLTLRQLSEQKSRHVIPTGCLAVDRLFSGGLPTGVPIMLYGAAGSGKTTIANSTIANLLRIKPESVVVYILTEGDIPYRAWHMFGIPQTDRILVFHQNEYGEHTLDAVFQTLRKLKPAIQSGEIEVGAIVLDSLAGLLPHQDLISVESKGSDSQTMATHSRLTSQFFKLFGGTGMFSRALTIITNQYRETISAVPSPKSTTGGHAARHWCKVHLELSTSTSKRITKSDVKGMEVIPGLEFLSELDDAEVVGHIVDVQLRRNSTQYGRPQGRTQYRVIYDYGFDNFTPLMDAAIRYGIVQQRGSFYEYANVKVAGRTQMIGRLVADGIWSQLQERVQAILFQNPVSVVAGSGGAQDEEVAGIDVQDDDPVLKELSI